MALRLKDADNQPNAEKLSGRYLSLPPDSSNVVQVYTHIYCFSLSQCATRSVAIILLQIYDRQNNFFRKWVTHLKLSIMRLHTLGVINQLESTSPLQGGGRRFVPSSYQLLLCSLPPCNKNREVGGVLSAGEHLPPPKEMAGPRPVILHTLAN